jgi:hypothetical protein
MKTTNYFIYVLVAMMLSLSFVSCEKDEPITPQPPVDTIDTVVEPQTLEQLWPEWNNLKTVRTYINDYPTDSTIFYFTLEIEGNDVNITTTGYDEVNGGIATDVFHFNYFDIRDNKIILFYGHDGWNFEKNGDEISIFLTPTHTYVVKNFPKED